MTLRELRTKRANIIKQARELVDKADAEKRDLSAEEQQQYDKAWTDIEALASDIDRRERLEEAERREAERELQERDRLAREERRGTERTSEPVRPPAPGDGSREQREQRGDRADAASAMEMRAFRRWLLHDRMGEEESRAWERLQESRALNAATDAAGAYTLAPEQFVNELLKAVDDAVYMRQWSRGFRVKNKNGLGVPVLDTDPADADWTTELLTGSEDSAMAFGKRALQAYPMAKRIKVSKTLLRSSELMVDQIVRDRLAYKFGLTWEKAMLTGDGSSKPLGVFIASPNGIDTGRDMATGNTATTITFDGLINAKYHLKGQYHANARWLFHRTAQREIAKLKDLDNQYLWRESVRAGEPDRVLGLPIFMSEFVPNTFTTGLYVGILGDFRFYWYTDMLDFQIQHLMELYAETNQDGFIGRAEGDGMPVLEEAFVRVTLA